MTESEFLLRMDIRLARMEKHMARGNELIVQIREEHQLTRREHRVNQARFESTRAVTREMVFEMREGRAALGDMRAAIQANTAGLLRVLDEMRRDDGGSPAGA